MEKKLRTVLGDIDPQSMGGALPHEHILNDESMWWVSSEDKRSDNTRDGVPTMDMLWYWQENMTANLSNLILEDEKVAIDEISDLRDEYGIGTIIEVTNIGLGRDITGLKRISEASGIHIVAGAGFYTSDSVSDEIRSMSEDQLFDIIVKDIEVGVDGTDIRAGVIGEVGLSWPIQPFEERMLAASVRAMKHTGVAMTLHSPYYLRDVSVLREICDKLEIMGADMSRVVMGHCDSFTRDPAFIEVASRFECMIQFDMFGFVGFEPEPMGFSYPPAETLVETIAALVKAGLSDRILISHDNGLKTNMKIYGGRGYGYISRVILPWLRHVGVDEQAIEQILIKNSQRIFPIKTK